MVTETEDLRPTLQELEKYLKQEGFTIFYGYETARSRFLTVVVWAQQKSDWKGFLRAAKEAGTKVIVIQTSSLEKQQLQGMLLEGRPEETKSTEAVIGLKRYLGKIGYIGLFWFKDGVKYSFSMSTDWWLQFSTAMATSHPPELSERLFEIPEDIRKKSEEELANELIEFVRKNFPSQPPEISWASRAGDLFWRTKGVESYYSLKDTRLQLKIQKAESLAKLKLEQETQMKEKEIVPELVDECVKWARENGLSKVAKTNVDYFLSEKKKALSKTSRDTIYSRVNFILRK